MSDDSPITRLVQGAINLGISLSPRQVAQFDDYLTELQKWNRKMNLSGANDPYEIVTRHFLDSLAGYSALQDLSEDGEVADLGAGAGFPGVPIKIAKPSVHLTLIEPRKKRAAFLLHLCGTLRMTEVQVFEEKISTNDCPPAFRHRFNRVLMRAVADPVRSAALARPIVRQPGEVIIWSSDRQADRVQDSFKRIRYAIPGTQIRSSLLIVSICAD